MINRQTSTAKLFLDTLLREGSLIGTGSYEFRGFELRDGKEVPMVYIGKVKVPREFAKQVVCAYAEGAKEFGFPLTLSSEGLHLLHFYKEQDGTYQIRKKKIVE